MSKHDLKYRPYRNRRSLDASNAGPLLRLTGAVFAVLLVLALVVFLLVPKLMQWFGYAPYWSWNATPTPQAAVSASPTPHPVSGNTVARLYLPDWLSGQVTTDFSAWQDTLLFAAGQTSTTCDKIYACDTRTGKLTEAVSATVNGGLRYPKENDKYLAYLDAKPGGGGTIYAVDLAEQKTFTVADVRLGAPRLFLEDIYLTWIERTDAAEFRLIVTDLSTGESVTIAKFTDSPYGASVPSLVSGQILYADEGTIAGKSVIESVLIESGDKWTFDPGTYVHDPRSNGNCWAWMAGNHGEDSDLYVSIAAGTPKCIARGIVDFGMTSSLVVYSRDETIFAYVFGDNKTYVLSETGTRALLLMAENGYVVWSDITDENNPVIYYIKAN